MRNSELFQLARRNLLRRKSRTALTVLSVVIGAVAIILMLSFGYGLEKNQRRQMAQFAQMNAITVTPSGDRAVEEGKSTRGLIRDREIERIREIANVKDVLGIVRVQFQAVVDGDGKKTLMGDIQAIDFKMLNRANLDMVQGSLPGNVRNHPFLISKNVPLFSFDERKQAPNMEMHVDWSAHKLTIQPMAFAPGGPGQQTQIKLKYGGTYQGSDLLSPNGVYISLETYDAIDALQQRLNRDAQAQGMAPPEQELQHLPKKMTVGLNENTDHPKKSKPGKRTYDQLTVTVQDLNRTQQVVDEINMMGLNAQSNSDAINNQLQALKIVQLVFAGIGSVALLVSAIGIANTMLMSIHERTREIGVMKVVGAQIKDIRRMFLVEAMLIALIGGVIGILLSYGISAVVNILAGKALSSFGGSEKLLISYIPFWLPFAAFVFSGFVGLLAGSLPANRATRISAIEAIRTE